MNSTPDHAHPTTALKRWGALAATLAVCVLLTAAVVAVAPARFGAYGEALRDEAQADRGLLAGRLLGVVGETMQPAHLSLWLKPRERPHS